MPKVIDSFTYDNAFLSNFYNCPVQFGGYTFQNSEAAFQSMKCPERMKEFTNLSPSSAKALGRRVQLRSDWEEVKDYIMEAVCYAKFTQNDDLKQKLIATGDAKLVEGNTWNDIYWGMCKGKGQNKLGEILMKLREEFQNESNNTNLQVGDVCLYYYNTDIYNRTLCLVLIHGPASKDTVSVKILQVFNDDSGNDLFKYLEGSDETMVVSKCYLHKVDFIDKLMNALYTTTVEKPKVTVEETPYTPTPPDEEFPIEFKLVVSNSGNRSISVCVNNDEVITGAEDITEAIQRFDERIDEIDVY